jgi:hypothetical protein
METLKQKRLFKSYYFKLGENYLDYRIKSWFTSFEEEYPYEDLITRKTIYHRHPNYWLLVIFLILLLGSIFEWADYIANKSDKEPLGTLIWFSLIVILLGILFYISAGANLLIKTVKGGYIFFMAQGTAKNKTLQFIDELRLKQKKCLLEKYVSDPGRDLEERFGSLKWIRDNEIITAEEYEKIKAELDDFGNRRMPPSYLN